MRGTPPRRCPQGTGRGRAPRQMAPGGCKAPTDAPAPHQGHSWRGSSPPGRWSIRYVQAGDGEMRVTARPWQVRVGKRQRRMGNTTTRRLVALALGAIVSAGSGIASSRAAHAGGDCPPGWNAPVKKQDSGRAHVHVARRRDLKRPRDVVHVHRGSHAGLARRTPCLGRADHDRVGPDAPGGTPCRGLGGAPCAAARDEHAAEGRTGRSRGNHDGPRGASGEHSSGYHARPGSARGQRERHGNGGRCAHYGHREQHG